MPGWGCHRFDTNLPALVTIIMLNHQNCCPAGQGGGGSPGSLLLISRWSMIVRVSVVLKWLLLMVTDALPTCAVDIFMFKVSCIKSVDGIKLWFLTCGQLSCDVIGPLSVKLWCYWLWRILNVIGAFWSVYLSQFNSHLLLVKLSVFQSICHLLFHSF